MINLVCDQIPESEIDGFVDTVEKLLDAYYEELDRDTGTQITER